MTSAGNDTGIVIVLLAAGSSRRFDGSKQLASWQGKPLVRHALDTASSTAYPTVLVLGHEWQAVRQACHGSSAYFVLNPDYADGMATSLACGVRAVRQQAQAILVMPCDQPLLTSADLTRLATRWSGAANEIVASRYTDVLGTPALFGRDCFAQLLAQRGDRGARGLFEAAAYEVVPVDCERAATDVDTTAELKTLTRSVRN